MEGGSDSFRYILAVRGFWLCNLARGACPLMAWTKIGPDLIDAMEDWRRKPQLKLLVTAAGKEPVVAFYNHGHWHVATSDCHASPPFTPTHYWPLSGEGVNPFMPEGF